MSRLLCSCMPDKDAEDGCKANRSIRETVTYAQSPLCLRRAAVCRHAGEALNHIHILKDLMKHCHATLRAAWLGCGQSTYFNSSPA